MRDLVGLIVWAVVDLFRSRAAIEAEKITRYGTLIAWAKMLGRNDCASVLQQNLDEEKLPDSKLTRWRSAT